MNQNRPDLHSMLVRRPTGVSRFAGAALAAAVVLVGVATPGAAVPPDPASWTVTGVVDEVVVDPGGLFDVSSTTAVNSHESGDVVTERFVDVDGVLLDIPAGQDALLADSERVDVTVSAPSGENRWTALDHVDQDGAPRLAVTGVETAPAPSVPGTLASVALAAASPVGAHTLTVLPIYWTAPDAATKSNLSTVATQTAQFWSDQSGGQMTTTTKVNDWVKVTDPGSCDATALYNLAVAAHRQAAPTSSRNHIVVYFPHRGDCGGWAGMASVSGTRIWINGYPRTDVLAHEFGHNLGLGHANRRICSAGGVTVSLSADCTVKVYYDAADVMGYSTGQAPGNLNTALASTLGYVRAVEASPSGVVTVDLAPLGETGATRALRIPTSDGIDTFVDFRPALGLDLRVRQWAGVQVHRQVPTELAPTSELVNMQAELGPVNERIAMLPGAVYAIPGSLYTLKVVSVGLTRARVSVYPTASVTRFWDVAVAHPFFAQIAWLASTGVATGYADGAFGGAAPVSRAAMAAFLYRFAGSTAVAPAYSAFADVPMADHFFTEISWLASTGITTGYADGTFGGAAPVSRAAMAAFLYRFAGSTAVAPAYSAFADVPTTDHFFTEISWLASTGITTGYSDGTFGGAAPVSRAAMAAFLYRYAQTVVDGVGVVPLP